MRNLVLICIWLVTILPIFACDMVALIALNDHSLAYEESVTGNNNDPFDFFDFIKLRSAETLQNDGYGILYYPRNLFQINQNFRWYKTGLGVWYGDGNDEPMDLAIPVMMNADNQAKIIMAHARRGTGGEGSHPFWLNINNRTYSFMHNGAISNNLKTAMLDILGAAWFAAYPSNWQGEYPDTNSFIDSEVIFHYLMSYIIRENSVVIGITKALNQTNIGGNNLQNIIFSGQFIINFVLSDGEKLYIFRNSNANSNTRLSFQKIDERFVAIKTHDALTYQVTTNKLLEISSSGIHEYSLQNNNPVPFFTGLTNGNEILLHWNTLPEESEKGWNLYRNIETSNFHSAIKLNQSILYANHSGEIHFSDSFQLENASYYYWRECLSGSGLNSLYPPIKVTFQYSQAMLKQNFPNPFRDNTTISWLVPENEPYQLIIYNLLGQKVRVYDKLPSLGRWQELNWDSKDEENQKLPAGIYFYQLKTKHSSNIRKMILLW
jgi:hypothetical protein